MAVIEWDSNKFSVNVKLFDSHHLKLVEIINKLHDANSFNYTQEIIFEIIDELIDYTVFHFSTEEKALEKHGYSDITNHKKFHRGFVEIIGKFKQKIEKGDAVLWTSIEMISYLRDWLLTHILVEDKKYSNLLKDKVVE